MTSDQNNTAPVMTVQQFAARHGVNAVTARLWCAEGLIPGAAKIGRDWMIPSGAERPVDGRTTRYRKGDQAT